MPIFYFISGVTKDETNTPAQKAVAVFARSATLPLVEVQLSDPVTGAYNIQVADDVTEHVVVCFDSTNAALPAGESGENALVYDRVLGI
jgi:hypothetical protein